MLRRLGIGFDVPAFADVVAASPDYAPGHIGLANAHALAFEATRAECAKESSEYKGAAAELQRRATSDGTTAP